MHRRYIRIFFLEICHPQKSMIWKIDVVAFIKIDSPLCSDKASKLWLFSMLSNGMYSLTHGRYIWTEIYGGAYVTDK